MRKFIMCLLTAMTLSVTSAYAGPGSGAHSHAPTAPVSNEQALQIASGVVANLVEKGKIDASWVEVKPTEAKMKMFKQNHEWVVTFSNPKVTDQEKKTLYVFLSLDGQILAANFTGS